MLNYQICQSLISIKSLAIRASGAGLQLGSFRILQQEYSKNSIISFQFGF